MGGKKKDFIQVDIFSFFLFNHRCKKNEPFSFKVDLGRFKNKKNKKRRKNKNSAKNTVTNWKILGTILDRETNMLHDFYLPELSADLFEIHKSESWEIHLTVSPTSRVTPGPLTIISGFPVTNTYVATNTLYDCHSCFIFICFKSIPGPLTQSRLILFWSPLILLGRRLWMAAPAAPPSPLCWCW